MVIADRLVHASIVEGIVSAGPNAMVLVDDSHATGFIGRREGGGEVRDGKGRKEIVEAYGA